MFRLRRWFVILVVVGLASLAALWVTRARWLSALGRELVLSNEPFQADAVVVLAGDDTGGRILKGAQLIERGFAPLALVSGPRCCYGMHESDLAIPFAIRKGYPAQWFIPVHNTGRSTRDEAGAVMREIERRKLNRFIVVTSNYHTARAARVYAALVPEDRFRVVASADEDFVPETWWYTREGEKTFLMEWMKTFAYRMGH